MSKVHRSNPHPPASCRNNSGETRGRVNAKGNADDSIGRLNAKGNADDSIGRLNAKGNADDSIGRLNAKGNADDSIGQFSTSKYSARPGMWVKGQYIQPGPTAQARNTRASNGTSLGLGLGMGFGALGSKDMKRAMEGLNKKAQEAARSLTMGASAANKVLGSSAFQKLPKDDRESIINVMAHGGPAAAPAMAKLFKNNQQDLLFKQDSAGISTLRNIERISQSKRADVAGQVLADIADPRRIQQGYAPTCTATSMQYELAKERPEEYARLMGGLAVEGRATMLGGGVLEVNASDALKASDRNHDFRSDSEAVFQSAVMEYANGADRYNLKKQRSEREGSTYKGLYPDQIRTMTGQLFGAHYETRNITNDAEARDELSRIMSRERPNRPVLFDLSMGSYNHNVSLESVTDKRVSFRDPSTGDIMSMSREDFIKRLTSVHYATD